MTLIKTILFIPLVSIASVPALAQRACLKVGILNVLASTVKLDLETSASPRTSITISPSYTNTGKGDGMKGGALEAGVRFYFGSDSLRMRGHYFHGTIQYGNYKTRWTEVVSSSSFSWYGPWPEPEYVERSEIINQLGFDVVWGYQFVIQKYLCIDLYAGVGLRNGGSSRTDLVPGISPGYDGPILKTGAKLGFAF